MESYDVRRLALVLAVQAEIEGKLAANSERQQRGESLAYPEESFLESAKELRNLAHCHDLQL